MGKTTVYLLELFVYLVGASNILSEAKLSRFVIRNQNILYIMQVKRTDEQLDLMEWKMDNVEKQMVKPLDQDVCIVNLLKSVSEVRSLLLFYHS